MRTGPLFFRWHRWLAYAVALQVLAWVLGGALFAWLPFQGWVKGGDWVHKPQVVLPADWPQALSRSLAAAAAGTPASAGTAATAHADSQQAAPQSVNSVHSVATARGPAWRLRGGAGDRWLAADGSGALAPPDEAAVRQFAQQLYHGPGRVQAVQLLAQAPRRLGLVREMGARSNLWQVRFDDALQTRLYVDGVSGELLAVRTEAWVLYDFFWRLHVMDYSEGEDFNNPLLRAVSLLALALALTGGVLVFLALARAWRRRQARRAGVTATGA